jgi:nuclear GTP-binding protein
LEVPTETTQNNPEEETTETEVERSDSITEKEPEGDCSQDRNSEMQQILARVRQNFGKINVGPQFSADDLVPVEMSDLEDLESSGEEEEQEQEQPGEDAEEERSPDTQEEPVGNDTKAVLRALDEKIAKYQRFLNKAKAKKFSAVR